jgi:molybdate transport system substrate-binding protein
VFSFSQIGLNRPSARRLVLAGLIALLTIGGKAAQAANPAPTPLRIAAAADVQPVLPAVIAQFEQLNPNQPVTASYQSSATLATQIENGAPFDLFLAADLSFPQRVIAAGLGESAQPIPYARGTLVLWARKDSRFQPITMAALRDASLKTVAIANPGHAPYGRAAKAALASLNLTGLLQGKLVVAENIAQTAQFVDSGNAELGLISLTSALTDRLKSDGTYIEVPTASYPPILQGAVIVKNSANEQPAHAFLNFLMSPAIQQQLSTEGLKPPQ